ncbi:MAG: gliding motility-associated protein GldE [Cyclobacteriaceae bacterium]|nr:gliding motility-associated protein GldE [Cyclobacteriaceae bacterium]
MDEPPSQDFLILLAGTDSSFLIISGVVLLILLFFSALISGSEVAFFSLTSEQLDLCKSDNRLSNKLLLKLARKPRLLLATILIFNNLVNVAIITLSTVVMWNITGGQEYDKWITAATTATVTFAIVFFGEVLPKIYAIQSSLTLARFASPVLSAFQFISYPLAFLLTKVSSVIEKRVEQRGYDISIDQMNRALELTTKHNESTEEERDILKGIVNFGTLTVTQVMKSRIDITAIDKEIDFHELMDKINKSGFSRIPVYEETIDKINGILYVKDLLPYVENEEDFEWQELIRPGFYVPESKKVDALLKDFQEKRIHMAIVVDEYGGTSGLITLEDVIEEIIGEINDEFDEDDIIYNKLDDNTYIFEGKTLLNDFCKIIDIEPSEFDEVRGESETIGGLLLEINGKLPTVGERIVFDRFVFTTVAADQKRIKRVRILIQNLK